MTDESRLPSADPADVELASAYLDGETDATERARVEAEPHLLALVAELRALQSTIADVAPVPDAVREAAIAAALADHDAAAARVADGLPTATPTPERAVRAPRRARQWRFLGGAAAAAVAALVGVAVVSNGGGGGTLATKTDASRTFDVPAAGAPADGATPEAATPRPTIDAIGGPAEAAPVISTTDEVLAIVAAQTAATTAGGSPDANAPSTTTSTMRDASVAPPCVPADQTFVAQVVWIDTPAVIRLDPATGIIQVVATDGCALLVALAP
jgi:hypothetical protein